MNFKNCNYYEKSIGQEHCPFDKVCDYDCYFVHKLTSENYEELEEKYEEVCSQVNYLESQEREVEKLEEQLDDLNNLHEEMFTYLKQCIETIIQNNISIPELYINYFSEDWKYDIQKYINSLIKKE